MDRLKDYLGGGVYVEFNGHSFCLRANDHRDVYCTDVISLDRETIEALNRFVKRVNDTKGE